MLVKCAPDEYATLVSKDTMKVCPCERDTRCYPESPVDIRYLNKQWQLLPKGYIWDQIHSTGVPSNLVECDTPNEIGTHKSNETVKADNAKYVTITSLKARFMGPTWGPSGADRTQVGLVLAPWTLLSGMLNEILIICCAYILSHYNVCAYIRTELLRYTSIKHFCFRSMFIRH